MSDWLVKKGVKRQDAQKYITSLFVALSEDAVVNSKKELKYLVKESQTPKGLNEQGLKLMSCLLYTSPSPRDGLLSRMPSSA